MLKQGYKVITENLHENPQCPHGPTLIFQRLVNGEPQSRKFYGCSACRDRKDCKFFLWCDEELSVVAKNAWEEEKKKITPNTCREKSFKEVTRAITENDAKNCFFCHSCTRVSTKNGVNKEHRGHNITGYVKTEQLKSPTKLLHALQDTTKEAQFFFTDKALKCLNNVLNNLNASTVISIGTPRLVEHLNNTPCEVDVLLLDLDWRYGTFYGENFCWYNMFNHHFLGTTEDADGKLNKQSFIKFLSNAKKEGSFVIVMDPPFGGRVEALANTLKLIEKEIRQLGRSENIYCLWIYPYFMESYIKVEMPDCNMLDYKVNYTNHPDYNLESKLGLKQGSPVRIFTNAPPNLISLPTDEGYHYCSKCQRFVSKENKHCSLCNACTSKDGRTYIHCKKCKRCVKPTWKHCNTCRRCCLVNHKCNFFNHTKNLHAASKLPPKIATDNKSQETSSLGMKRKISIDNLKGKSKKSKNDVAWKNNSSVKKQAKRSSQKMCQSIKKRKRFKSKNK